MVSGRQSLVSAGGPNMLNNLNLRDSGIQKEKTITQRLNEQ